MADIFKEVDEDLRRDNFEKLWKKYGFYFIGLAVTVVLAVAGVQGWRAYDLDQRGKMSDRYGAAWERSPRRPGGIGEGFGPFATASDGADP